MSNAKKKSYNNMISALEQIADSWARNYPTFVSSTYSQGGLLDIAQRLAVERDATDNKSMNKRSATNDLDTINAKINKMVDALRHFIRGFYIENPDVNGVLGSYGLVPHTPTPRLTKSERRTLREIRKAIAEAQTPEEQAAAQTRADANADLLTKGKKRYLRYIVPSDNDERMHVLQNIIDRLSRPGDPVGNISATYIQSWADTASEHQRIWRGSKNITSDISTSVQNSKTVMEEAVLELRFLANEISARFRVLGDDLTAKLRSFGYIAEVQ